MLALFALLLIPTSYRAGAAIPHGHALIQLIFEAQSGIPVHYHGVDQVHVGHGGDVASSQAGAPAIQVVASAGLMPMILIALAFQTLRTSIRFESDARKFGRPLTPDDPPPR